MDNNPNELSPRLMLALQHLRSSDATSAVQVLNGVEEGQKDNTQYLLLMAQAKLGVKEHTHAIRLLKTLLNRNPELPQAHFMLAMAYGADNDLNRMRESLEQTVKMAPTNFLANLYLARLYYSEKKTEPFLAQVEKITAINPEHPDVRLLNASKASIAGDYAGAIKILLALKKDNSHPEVYLQLADNQRKSGQLEQAIATLEKWPGSMEQDARVSFLLAQYYMEGMSYSQAREVYLRLEKMMPDNMVLLNNLAWLMRDIDISRGIEFGEKALKINPENPMVQDTVAMLYLSNGQNRKALDLASRAASTLPDYVEIQVNYARALIANDRSAKARDLLKRLKSKAASSSDRKLIDEVLSSL
jgi:putative PEP-CTERM system TPR-repeat lipoprotein